MAEQKQDVRSVRCLIAPLEGLQIVLPNSVIIQIVSYSHPAPVQNSPDWLIGTVLWQKRKIPVMSFEVATGRQFNGVGETSKYIIFKSLNHRDVVPFYAIAVAGIPHPERIGEGDISLLDGTVLPSPLILNQVEINGEEASIPNLDVLEEMLIQQQELLHQHDENMKDKPA